MATLANIPTEVLFLIMSRVSYRDRAHVALVSQMLRDIADDEESYKVQYIRDFGNPASHEFFTGHKIGEEVSWKKAYECRHFADMPLLVQDRLAQCCGV